MLTVDWLILLSVDAAIAVALVGLVARQRLRLCYTFDLYLFMVLGLDLLVVLWPQRFFHWEYFLAKETVHNILKFAIVLELTALIFAGFPRVRRTVRLMSGGVVLGLVVTMVAMWRYVHG